MKKVFITIVSLIILCCGVISLTACDDDDKVYKLTDIPYIDGLSYTDIDHITLIAGAPMGEEAIFDTAEQIDEIVNILSQMEFSHTKEDDLLVSYSFDIKITYQDETQCEFGFIDGRIQNVSGDVYILTDSELQTLLYNKWKAQQSEVNI